MAKFYREGGELCFRDDEDRTFTVDSVWESDGPGDTSTTFFVLGLDFETEDYVMYYCVKDRGGYVKDSNVKKNRLNRNHVEKQDGDRYDVRDLNDKTFRDPLFFKQGIDSSG